MLTSSKQNKIKLIHMHLNFGIFLRDEKGGGEEAIQLLELTQN